MYSLLHLKCPDVLSNFKKALAALPFISIPGKKLQRQLQVVFQSLKLKDITASTDIAKE